MSYQIVSGNLQHGIFGAKVPPFDTTTSVHIAAALGCFSNRKVILVRDLNLALDSLETDRGMEIANILVASALLYMYHHFKSIGRLRSSSTWHQKREGTVAWSRPDYFLCTDRRISGDM